jgi:hypothetical protein
MEFTRTLATFALSLAAFAGCYSAPDAGLDDTGEAVDEAVGTSWRPFVGAWVGDSGPFRGLVFTQQTRSRGRHFFAYVDNGIRCVRAPCPSEAQVEGYFTAASRTVTLRPSPAVTFPTVSFGVYQYALRGERLTLSQGGRVVAELRKAVSYCGEASDCAEQSLIAPRCLGRWTCTAERACRYVCGTPISTCANVRCSATTHCVESATGPRCVANGPSCAAIRCAAGFVCRDTDGVGACIPQNRVCGTAVCAEGNVCCNPLRGICTPPGWACIQ